MKKTVVVNLEYMRPSVGGRGRSQSPVNRIITSAIEKSALCYDSLLYNGRHDYESSESDDDTSDDGIDTNDESSETSSMSNTEPLSYEHSSVNDADYAVNSDDDLFQSVLDEPTFPLDVNAILSAMTKTENSTIANMTVKKIAARRHEILSSLNLTPEKMAEFERKLHMYRVVETPHELKHNQLIRWIPLRSLETRPYVTLGGCLFRVKYNEEESLHIVTIRNVKRFVFNIKFELNVVFQRLSQEELLILRAVEYVESDDIVEQPSS